MEYKVYDGYFSDNANWFVDKTPIVKGLVSSFDDMRISTGGILSSNSTYKSVQWFGVFIPIVAGTYTFYINSDDASYLWIGDTATSGYTTVNANISNGGIHGMIERNAPYSMTAGTRYPIRIQYGQNLGSIGFSFSFTAPSSGTRVYDMTGYVYNI